MNDAALNRVFHALSDATRRGMLAQLSDGEANISSLAAPYAISQPAASKHVSVLEQAGLVEKQRRGREQFVRVNARPLEDAGGWIAHYARFWRAQFDAVETYLQKNGRTPS